MTCPKCRTRIAAPPPAVLDMPWWGWTLLGLVLAVAIAGPVVGIALTYRPGALLETFVPRVEEVVKP